MKRLILILLLIPGLVWGGVEFDNVDDLIDVGDVDITGGFSASMWYYTNSVAGNQLLISDYLSTEANDTNYQILFVTDDVRFYMYNGSLEYWFVLNKILTSTWQHIVVTYNNAGTAELYVNGVNTTMTFGSAPNPGSWLLTTNNANTYIGSRPESDIFFDGKISEVAIWNVALTQAEVNILYNSKVKGMPLQIQPANLVGYWPLDDEEDGSSGDGDTFVDRSGNGNNGTGDHGGNASGLTAKGEEVLSYP